MLEALPVAGLAHDRLLQDFEEIRLLPSEPLPAVEKLEAAMN
jgi:hypothetical protein